MHWMLLVGIVALAATLSGCVDPDEPAERECLASRRCASGAESVCGADGQTYACASMAACYGVDVDASGEACGDPQCDPVTCELACDNGFATDADGCEICQCRDRPQECPPVQCDPDCPYGQETDDNGCLTCECIQDPPVCPPECDLYCPNGHKIDDNGCELCECRDQPDTCENDPCVANYCASRQATCIRESVLATSGACPPSPDIYFRQPPPQCQCLDDGCAPAECDDDADCPGDRSLCVGPDELTTPAGPIPGNCAAANCDDLATNYIELGETPDLRSCQTDDDCTLHRNPSACCGRLTVNSVGNDELDLVDQFAARTSCNQRWNLQCANVDCVPFRPSAVRCIDETCQLPE